MPAATLSAYSQSPVGLLHPCQPRFTFISIFQLPCHESNMLVVRDFTIRCEDSFRCVGLSGLWLNVKAAYMRHSNTNRDNDFQCHLKVNVLSGL